MNGKNRIVCRILSCIGMILCVVFLCYYVEKQESDVVKIKQEETLPQAVRLKQEYSSFAESYYVEQSEENEHKEQEKDIRYEIIGEVFKKFEKEESPWFVFYNNMYIKGYMEIGNSIILYGQNETKNSDEVKNVWLAKLDKDGNKIWDKLIENVYNENLCDVLIDGENIYMITRVIDYDTRFSEVDLLQINMDGELTNRVATDLKGTGDMVQYKDNLYVIYGSGEMIVRLEPDGRGETVFANDEERFVYEIIDVYIHNDKMYISTNEFNKGEYKNLSEYADFDNWGNDGYVYYEDEQIKAYMNQNKAHLFVYDGRNECKLLKTEENMLASGIGVDEAGELIWYIHSMEKGALITGSSTGGVSTLEFVYEYVFDENSNLISNDRLEYAVKGLRP